MWQRLPKFTKSFYFIVGLIFLVWMLFLDSNDVIAQYRLTSKLKDLQEEKAYYQQKIEEVTQEREELLSDQELLEKFAREKYFMKKKSEDLYIIVEE